MQLEKLIEEFSIDGLRDGVRDMLDECKDDLEYNESAPTKLYAACLDLVEEMN